MKKKEKKKRTEADLLLHETKDRRLFPNVPDPSGKRSNTSRRNNHEGEPRPEYAEFAGQRYEVEVDVAVSIGRRIVRGKTENLSQTGMLLKMPAPVDITGFEGKNVTLDFRLHEGDLQEGTEMRYRRLKAKIVRVLEAKHCVAIQFDQPLYEARKRTDRILFLLSTLFLALCTSVIMAMRVESIRYFATNPWLYGYSIMTAVFLLSRYLFGSFYKPTPIDPEYTPSVTIVIPCFNEEKWIRETILRCADQDYPVDKLDLIIVDDGSSDKSVEVIKQTVRDMCAEGPQYNIENRVRVFFQNYNQGKREAMGIGIRNARTELIVFVDSDSFLYPNAIRTLVQPMKDPQMGGVAGRTDVANVYTNWLTKMQAVRYYISFRIMKAAEAYFDSVMCLSGPLSCYRLEVVQEVFDKWINQRFMGQKATFGDDRSLTNYVVEHYRTGYQDHAICSTIVPNQNRQFLRQQMRWKRSWLRESLRACTFMWKKQPFMALSFYLGVLVPLIAPIIVLYNLVYVPFVKHIFPAAFLIGLLMMSLMMCFAQLILKKSSLWIYGFFFCLYYEVILLWQMIWAWLTFWVNDWGTRGKGKKRSDMAANTGQKEAAEHG
ncbi:MAG: glycosyltransferase [Oscillospiraceae bacterium]|nr:glycosyltransferase [Oscillospiraceae bacterium]